MCPIPRWISAPAPCGDRIIASRIEWCAPKIGSSGRSGKEFFRGAIRGVIRGRTGGRKRRSSEIPAQIARAELVSMIRRLGAGAAPASGFH